MSTTNFDPITRSSIWNANNETCFYCRKHVEWTELHIDHIIPESLIDKPIDLQKLISDYGLDQNYDLNALYNLVPSHGACNTRKSDAVFEKATTLYYLEINKSKELAIQEERAKIQARHKKGSLLSKLQCALATRLVSLQEFEATLKQAKLDQWDSKPIQLSIGISFIDDLYDLFYLKADYSSLYEKKLLLGGVYDHLELSNDDNSKVMVSTLKEWLEWTGKGYYPLTNADMKMSHAFTDLDALLNALKAATIPKASFVNDPWIRLCDVDYFSPSILTDPDNNLAQDIAEGKTLGDLVRSEKVKINHESSYEITIEYDGMEVSLTEQFRADFNNDGIEEIFVNGWERAIGGTFGYGFTAILSRRSGKELIKMTK